jgi:ABC-type transporter Mla subunit MlaD
MGDVYLEVELMDPKENPPPAISWTPQFPYLPSAPSTGTQVTNQVVSILHNLQGMRFDQISDKVITLLDSLDRLVKKLDPALADVHDVATEAGGLLKDTRRVVNEDLGPELKNLLTSTSDRLPATFDKIDGTLDRLSATLRRVDRTLAEEGGSMNDALDNMRAATGDLRDLMGQVKRNPAQALFGEPPPKKEVAK